MSDIRWKNKGLASLGFDLSRCGLETLFAARHEADAVAKLGKLAHRRPSYTCRCAGDYGYSPLSIAGHGSPSIWRLQLVNLPRDWREAAIFRCEVLPLQVEMHAVAVDARLAGSCGIAG